MAFVHLHEPVNNMISILNIIHVAKTSRRPLLLLSIDAEKPFARVNWQFMRATLEHIGLGPAMLRWISALYSHPSAAIKVNKSRFDFFPITNRKRQGCPALSSRFYSNPITLSLYGLWRLWYLWLP